jgi:hypothetical protein
MKGRIKLLSIFLAAALFCGFSAGCAPGPKEVCNHIEKLSKKELGEAAAKKISEGCVRRWKRKKEFKGYFKYRKVARCVVGAKKLSAVTKCK